MCDSVTVSMAALTMGMFRLILRVSCVCVTGLRGNNVGASGQQKDVVESKSLRNGKMNHKLSRELSQPYGVNLHSREGGGLRQMEWEDILPIRRRSIRKAADNGCLYIALGQFTVSGAVRLPTLPVTLSRTTKRTV